MVDDIFEDGERRMQKAVEVLKQDLSSIRTGRASSALVERITVDYYGAPTPINQVASISVPEARLLVIQPWDRKLLIDIEKAIQKSDLGINPNNDGQVIRLAIPRSTKSVVVKWLRFSTRNWTSTKSLFVIFVGMYTINCAIVRKRRKFPKMS